MGALRGGRARAAALVMVAAALGSIVGVAPPAGADLTIGSCTFTPYTGPVVLPVPPGGEVLTAECPGANLAGADLAGVVLYDADLSGADLRDADLSGADLVLVEIAGANLSRADLSSASMIGLGATGVRVRNADLTGSTTLGGVWTDADYTGSDLSGAWLVEVPSDRPNFSRTILNGTFFDEYWSSQPVFRGADLTGVDFSDADFDGADFGGTSLVPANQVVEPTGPAGAVVTWPTPGAVTGYAPGTCDHASGSTFAVGTTVVRCTVVHQPTGDTTSGGIFSVTVRPPAIIPGAAVVGEGGTLEIPVTLSAPSATTVTVKWMTVTVPGLPVAQSTPGADHVATGGVVTFPPGETTARVEVTTLTDAEVEPDELLVLIFGQATGARMGGFWGLGFGTITDAPAP